METFTTTISIILLLGLISVPILLYVGLKRWKRLKFNFLNYLTIGLILTAGITLVFGWWADYSDRLLMNNYGYNYDTLHDMERYQNVETAHLEKIKQLEIGYSGVGWPLQATMTFVFYAPYLLIVYLIGHLTTKFQRSSFR